MKINEFNGKIINSKEINLHDDVLTLFTFDRLDRKMRLVFNKYDKINREYTIVFLNVIGFSMTSCNFWGASECVLDFEYVDPQERVLIPALQKKWLEVPNELDTSCENNIETLITFSSGDQLRIACEQIIL